MVLKNKNILKEFELLLERQDWKHMKVWFGYWGSMEEMIDKIIVFGNFFMRHYFTAKSPAYQRELIKQYFSKDNEYNACPRGFAKTTNIQLCTVFSIVNKLDDFIVLIEKTFTEASEVLEGIRAEFEENDVLKAVYGELINIDTEKKEQYSKNKDARGDNFINGVRLRSVGFEKSIRGLKTRQYRPSRIICDDIETDEHIDSEEQRKKYRRRYSNAIVPATTKEGTLKIYGTILHFDSLLMNLIKQHNGKIYKAFYSPELDEKYDQINLHKYSLKPNEVQPFAQKEVKLLWHEYWDWAALMDKREQMMVKENQTNGAFFQEYRNDPTAEEDRAFKHEWLWNSDREVYLSALLNGGKNYEGYATMDWADSTEEKSNYTGIAVVLVDDNENWYPVSILRQKRNTLGKLDLIFELWNQWHKHGLNIIGIEKKAYEDEIKPQLDAEMDKRGIYPYVVELKHMGRSKDSRIKGALQGRYERGKIWTVLGKDGKPIEHTELMKMELYDFNKSAHDDLKDAMAYISDLVENPLKEKDNEVLQFPERDDPYRYNNAPYLAKQ